MIGSEPAKTPDEGEARVHATAGAVAIGARFPLIAFNVNLDSDDLDLARRIAVEIRERDGGMKCVKAMGLLLEDGAVQVSMNLTDYRVTSMADVVAAIGERADGRRRRHPRERSRRPAAAGRAGAAGAVGAVRQGLQPGPGPGGPGPGHAAVNTRRRRGAEGAPLPAVDPAAAVRAGRILITGLRLTPLFLTFKEPYHWAGRVDHGSPVVLVEVETDAGITGVGESVASLAAEGTVAALRCVEPLFVGPADPRRGAAGARGAPPRQLQPPALVRRLRARRRRDGALGRDRQGRRPAGVPAPRRRRPRRGRLLRLRPGRHDGASSSPTPASLRRRATASSTSRSAAATRPTSRTRRPCAKPSAAAVCAWTPTAPGASPTPSA